MSLSVHIDLSYNFNQVYNAGNRYIIVWIIKYGVNQIFRIKTIKIKITNLLIRHWNIKIIITEIKIFVLYFKQFKIFSVYVNNNLISNILN